MRLTLRTLLSYLDDTLEPAQAKLIGAKVAESEQARELMERIKQVTRRRRLTTPPTTGPGGMDANTIAEYLDNEVKDEKATEVEQICLASDVHLAEVAACHQILTLVLGEPALVPPSAKQRMYKLVHGPESIQTRKPGKTGAAADRDLPSEIDGDTDETLRLGVPAVGAGKGGLPRNIWLFVGGGVLAASLFVFAIWRLIHTIPHDKIEPKGDQVAQQNDKDAGKKVEPPKVDDKDKTAADKDKKDEKPPLIKKDEKPQESPQIKVESVDIKPPPEIPYMEASAKQAPIGRYLAPPIKAPAVLLQKDKLGWARIGGKSAAVSSGRMLLSLPGSKSVVSLDGGIELTLWGNLFEVTLDPVLAESRVTLHANDTLDADLTLDRGRIILRNDKKDGKDAVARVRFFNPGLAEENYFDIILTTGSAVAVERGAEMDREEPFFEDPKNTLRQGPIATMKIYSYGGYAKVLWAKLEYALNDSQPIVYWQSRKGLPVTPAKVVLPPWLKGMPPLDKDDPLARDRAIAIRAHDNIAKRLERDKPIDVVLAEVVQDLQDATQKEIGAKKGLSSEIYIPWRHVLQCYAAIDDVGTLFETFAADNTPIFVRGFCMTALQQWLPEGRNNDYELLRVVRKGGFKERPAINIMELFHLISAENVAKPATYQHLIEGLKNDLMPIRVLSHWHLMNLAPVGRDIPYDPAMPGDLRERAVREWLRRIPPGKLPPREMPAKKDKG